MREVHKDVNQVPVPNPERVRIVAALDPFVVTVATLHIVADEDPSPVRETPRRQWDRGHIEGIVERVEVRAGRKVLEGRDRV